MRRRPPTKKHHNDNRPWWAVILGVVSLVALFCGAWWMAETYIWRHLAEPSDGALVDQAWAMPGAILLTPHRDLTEMNIVQTLAEDSVTGETYHPEMHVCSPTIAIRTPKKWCLWELGEDCAFNIHSHLHHPLDHYTYLGLGLAVVETGGNNGYPVAFAAFQQCVQD